MTPRLAVGAVVLEHRIEGPHLVLARRGAAPRIGAWSLPGGRVEHRERLVDAIVREVREETGLDVRVEKLIDVVEIIDDDVHYVIVDYLCTPLGGSLQAGDDATEVCWAPVYDLVEYDVTPAVRRIVSMAISEERE